MQKYDTRKSAYKYVGKILRNHQEINKAVKEAREMQQCGGHTGGNGDGHSYVSDPTAQQAVRLATELRSVTLDDGWTIRRPEKWLRVIELTYRACYPYEEKAIRYYYAGHSALKTSEECGMDQSTFYRMRSDVIHIATELACQFGLVRVV